MAWTKEAAARRRAKRLASGDLCGESDCSNPRETRGLCKTHYNRRFDHHSTERDKARQRAKTHHRKAVGRHTDITLEYEQELRRKAKRCPLCQVRMTTKPYLPTSKELDHMIPLNAGGTHTVGNVRIICRTCNIHRPKDGNDYLGPVTLWATHPGFVARPKRQSREIPHCQCGAEKRSGGCWTCEPSRIKPRAADGRRAAAMRAEGFGWTDITKAVGFTNTGACYQAAKAHGDPDVVARWPERYARWKGPRPASNCA